MGAFQSSAPPTQTQYHKMKAITNTCIAIFAGLLVGNADAKPAKKIGAKAKVDTRWEKRADVNGNGRVSKKEATVFRQAVQERRVVDTKREERLDRNDDGVIGRREAQRARCHRTAAK